MVELGRGPDSLSLSHTHSRLLARITLTARRSRLPAPSMAAHTPLPRRSDLAAGRDDGENLGSRRGGRIQRNPPAPPPPPTTPTTPSKPPAAAQPRPGRPIHRPMGGSNHPTAPLLTWYSENLTMGLVLERVRGQLCSEGLQVYRCIMITI